MPMFRATRLYGFVVAMTFVSPWTLQAQEGALPAPLETPAAKASYGIGHQIGSDITRSGLQGDLLDLAALLQGIQDAATNQELRVKPEEIQAAMKEIQQLANRQMQEKMEALANKNKTEGPKFLKKYQAMEGVKKLPSGVLYRVLKAGTGPTPKATDVVRTHYRGRLIDGKEFDSSYSRNEPATFPVQGVISGWTEALQKMKVGDKWEIALSPELAYGEDGSPPVIGPNAVLVFEIELLGIEKAQSDASGQTP